MAKLSSLLCVDVTTINKLTRLICGEEKQEEVVAKLSSCIVKIEKLTIQNVYFLRRGERRLDFLDFQKFKCMNYGLLF